MIVIVALGGLLVAGLIYQWAGTRRQRRAILPPGDLIDVGGHRLHVHCAGRGTPLVLLEAGVAASSVSWSLVQPQIATFTRVCAYDRAGLAWSDAPSSPRTFERVVDELIRVLAHVAPNERYVLVGHSFGTFVVRAVAARLPQSVVGLVLVDPPTEWLALTPPRVRMIRGARHLSRIGALLARIGVVRACLSLLTGGAPGAPRNFVRIFGPTAAGTVGRLVGEVRKLPPDVHPIVKEHWCQPRCFHAMADHLRVLEREGSSMAAITVPADIPVAVISSGDQPPEQLAHHRHLAGAAETGRHIVASRSTHWVQFDQPELIVKAVRDVVESVGQGFPQ